MLRGCILALLFYLALAAGYFFWLDTVFEPPGSYIGAGVLGLVVFFCLGALMNARTAWKDWSLAATARHGSSPRDGRLTLVSGAIHPIGQPLIAPFSGTECVVCEYDVSRRNSTAGTSDDNPGSDFTGFLMVPSVIRGQLAEVRLLGFPILDGFSDSHCTGYADARRAIDFLTLNQFEDRTGLKMVSVLSVFGEIWSDEDGLVEKNIRLGKVALPTLFPPALEADIDRLAHLELAQPAPSDDDSDEDDEDDEEFDDDDDDIDDDFDDELDDDPAGERGVASRPTAIPRLKEKLVSVGQEVCAIGIYNELRRGLLPPGRGRTPNRLIRGTAEQLQQKSRSAVVSLFVGGLVFLLIAHAAAFGAMQLYQRSPELARQRQSDAFEAVKKGDIRRLAQLARRGMDVNLRDSSGRTLLMEASDPQVTAWLIARKIDVNAVSEEGGTALMHAARGGHAPIVEQLLTAGAEVNARDKSRGSTALMDAVGGGHDDVAQLLRAAGAEDDVITTANGRPLPDSGGPQLAVCREYLAALHARDPETLNRLTAGEPSDFAYADWDSWHQSHLEQVQSCVGFTRGEHATLKLTGLNGAGSHAEWTYQLRREAGQWKIAGSQWNIP